MPPETPRSRFQKVMSGQLPADRLPMIEWASWWHLTIDRWHGEGLPRQLGKEAIKAHFGLDMDLQAWIGCMAGKVEPKRREADGTVWIENEADYDKLLPHLYPKEVPFDRDQWRQHAAAQAAGNAIVWITLEGFFWWPRVLFGIEGHLLAFYDHPRLMHRINHDLAEYHLRCIEQFCSICTPDFMTFAEDMSYNHGPMIGRDLFDQFMAPYYRMVIPELKQRGIIPMIDSDGDVEPLIPWFQSVGLEGILPLERMAGVDVNRIRANHPTWKMIGGFDKTTMHRGEPAMRQEFERLLPAMRSARFIPSVDHQTPPGVSIAQYRAYLQLLSEYATKAVHLP